MQDVRDTKRRMADGIKQTREQNDDLKHAFLGLREPACSSRCCHLPLEPFGAFGIRITCENASCHYFNPHPFPFPKLGHTGNPWENPQYCNRRGTEFCGITRPLHPSTSRLRRTLFERTTSNNVPFWMNTSGSCELPFRGLIFRVLRLDNYAALQNISKLLDQYSSCKADQDNSELTMPDEKLLNSPN